VRLGPGRRLARRSLRGREVMLGFDALIRKPRLGAVAVDFFRVVVTELEPLLEAQSALRPAGVVGIEPWVVVALREREAGVLPGTRRSRVPWEVVRRFSRLEPGIDLGRSRRPGFGRPGAWPIRSGPVFVGLAAALAPARSHPASVWARRPGSS